VTTAAILRVSRRSLRAHWLAVLLIAAACPVAGDCESGSNAIGQQYPANDCGMMDPC
jgi:hypothetical protein